MGKVVVTVLGILLLLALNLSESKAEKTGGEAVSSIFEPGQCPTAERNGYYASKKLTLKVFTPTVAATYSVLLFFHGTCLQNYFYTSIFQFIASHGYIVVAPQLYNCTSFGFIPKLPIDGQDEVDLVAQVANWLPQNLDSVLPTNVKADLDKLAVSGHSRGAKAAFAIALGKAETQLTVKISALIGLDPVAGRSKKDRTDPKILSYVPESFVLSIPVTVIGTGLGNQTATWLSPAVCAPNEVNHVEFYNECKAPATHFVTTDYGHMDMLDLGWMDFWAGLVCKATKEPDKDPMRRTVGGIIASFLKACFNGDSNDFNTILNKPAVAPATLDPPQSKPLQAYAQI